MTKPCQSQRRRRGMEDKDFGLHANPQHYQHEATTHMVN